MPGWLIKLRDIVWISVIAVVLAVVAIVLAVANVGSPTLPVVFAITSVSMAILAQRV
jgi:hypothetical protein